MKTVPAGGLYITTFMGTVTFGYVFLVQLFGNRRNAAKGIYPQQRVFFFFATGFAKVM